MGRVKSKTTKKNNTKRNLLITVFVVALFSIILLLVKNPHPGYASLEKELDQITLPEGWSEVGPRTGEKDYWNMFCRDVTIKCPSIGTIINTELKTQLLKEFKELSEQNGYVVFESSPKCLSFDSLTGSRCYVRSIKGDSILSITLNEELENSNYHVGMSLRKSSED